MLRPTMAKKDTEQLHIRPPRSVINRLDELSRKYKRDSGNQVAVEILRDYIELWATAEQAKHDTILRQQQAVTRAIEQEAFRRPIHSAQTAEQGDETQAQRRKGKR